MPNLSPSRHDPRLVALGSAIRSLRKQRKLSQEQLAELAGADRSHLGRLERGDNEIAFLLLCRLADALGVTVAQLTNEAGL
ncbi:helix-turn-helix domain-containing protein [Duganella callida]|uniref:XRE family transcriptional regulator n=1 Tax=Duganella callida TaxID=2561932 RepID=A0A4Y9SBC9_9BURK|nr:helix-turn-helix transcriptional regulator [Duganella callida]TFW17551.1 XRE family transcriptional regulator [Duganella callida]